MDPDATLADIIEIAKKILLYRDEKLDFLADEDLFRLAFSIQELDEWISKDGFLPRRWFSAK